MAVSQFAKKILDSLAKKCGSIRNTTQFFLCWKCRKRNRQTLSLLQLKGLREILAQHVGKDGVITIMFCFVGDFSFAMCLCPHFLVCHLGNSLVNHCPAVPVQSPHLLCVYTVYSLFCSFLCRLLSLVMCYTTPVIPSKGYLKCPQLFVFLIPLLHMT